MMLLRRRWHLCAVQAAAVARPRVRADASSVADSRESAPFAGLPTLGDQLKRTSRRKCLSLPLTPGDGICPNAPSRRAGCGQTPHPSTAAAGCATPCICGCHPGCRPAPSPAPSPTATLPMHRLTAQACGCRAFNTEAETCGCSFASAGTALHPSQHGRRRNSPLEACAAPRQWRATPPAQKMRAASVVQRGQQPSWNE